MSRQAKLRKLAELEREAEKTARRQAVLETLVYFKKAIERGENKVKGEDGLMADLLVEEGVFTLHNGELVPTRHGQRVIDHINQASPNGPLPLKEEALGWDLDPFPDA